MVPTLSKFVGMIYSCFSIISYSFPASDHICHLLLHFENGLDADLDRQNVKTDLDPNCLTKYVF